MFYQKNLMPVISYELRPKKTKKIAGFFRAPAKICQIHLISEQMKVGFPEGNFGFSKSMKFDNDWI